MMEKIKTVVIWLLSVIMSFGAGSIITFMWSMNVVSRPKADNYKRPYNYYHSFKES